MTLPGAPSIAFVAYTFVLLPYAAIRSARTLRPAGASASAPAGGTFPPRVREKIWISTLLTLVLLFALAWFVGGTFGFRVFAAPALGVREWLAAAAALAVCLGVRAALRAVIPEERRRTMTIYRFAPRTGRERALWTATAIAAGVAEEAAYRGVAMAILTYAFGNAWLAALLCTIAFTVGHWTQEPASRVAVFVIALLMHALVAFTGTLVLAMLVHATYDLLAGHWISVAAKRYDREAATAPVAALNEITP